MAAPAKILARLRFRLRALTRGRAVRRDIGAEVRYHLESAASEYRDRGYDPVAAEKMAAERFGDVHATVGRLERICRVAGSSEPGGRPFEGLGLDVRYAAKTLRRAPGFVLLALLTLALGIGANTAIFSVVNGVLLRPLPFHEPGRIVLVYETDRARATTSETASAPDFADWVADTTTFEHLAAIRFGNQVLTGDGEAERVSTARVSAEWFTVLGVAPTLGRDFVKTEEPRSAERVALLSQALWARRFGSDPGVVGRTVRINDVPVQVVGVMPATAQLAESARADLWEPLRLEPAEESSRGMHVLIVIGRLAEGVSVAAAQAEMTTVMQRLEAAHPEDNVNRGARVVALQDELVADVRTGLVLLLVAVAVVQLIACANVANLSLARAVRRTREMAVRNALGAGRLRITRQLFAESLLIAGAGGVLGLGLAWAGVRALVALGPEVPRLQEATIDPTVLAFTIAVSLATGVLFGIAPAVRIARHDLRRGLEERGRGLTSARGPLRHGLVALEMGLAVVLVIAAGLLIRSFSELQQVHPGFDSQDLVTAQLDLPDARYHYPDGWPRLDWPEATTFYRRLIEETAALPGVESASLALFGPTTAGWTTSVTIAGRPPVPPELRDEARFRPVSDGYFRDMGVPLLHGREFGDRDIAGTPLVAVINESFARQYFPDGDPLGERVVVFGAPREIVGVASNVAFRGLAAGSGPSVYLPLFQNPLENLTLLVRSAAGTDSIQPALRTVVAAIDPDLALYNVRAVDDALIQSRGVQRFSMLVLTLFAAFALLLAAIGLYGVLSYAVSQRRREIGIRMALGAGRQRLVRMVLRDGLIVVATGLVAGLAVSFAFANVMESLLFGIRARDFATFLAVPAILAVVAAAACYLPARRASSVDPVSALRLD